MAPGGEPYRLYERFGENVLRHGSHEWLPYSKDEVRLKTVNNNLRWKAVGDMQLLYFCETSCPPPVGYDILWKKGHRRNYGREF